MESIAAFCKEGAGCHPLYLFNPVKTLLHMT